MEDRDPKWIKLNDILSMPEVELEQVRKLCWTGAPKDLRASAWKVLIGYSSTKRESRDSLLERKRLEYQKAKEKIETQERTMEENRLLRDILVDVPRTMPEMPVFHFDKVQESIGNILYVWAIRHPASGYVQGMNDLLTPFYACFLAGHVSAGDVDALNTLNIDSIDQAILDAVEADSYFCLTRLLDSIQDHYTCAQPGIQRMVYRLESVIQRIDKTLFTHLENEGVGFMHIAFRWINCLLLREFELSISVRLWDTLLAEGSGGFENFHVYVCAALLTTWSNELTSRTGIHLNEYLKKLPTQDWTEQNISELTAMAYMLKEMFNDCPSHLGT